MSNVLLPTARRLGLLALSGLAASVAAAQAPVANDSIGGAPLLNCGQRVVGSTVGARVFSQGNAACLNSGTPGRWYRFQAPTSGTYQANACGPATDFAARLLAFDPSNGCVGSPAAAAGCAPGSTVSFPATAGQLYFLFVTGSTPTARGNFELTLRCSFVDSANCVRPSNVVLTRLTDSLARVSFTPVAGSAGYQVSYQAPGEPARVVAPAPVAPPVFLSGLRPGVAYTVSIATICPPAPSQPVTTNSARVTVRLSSVVLSAAASRAGAGPLEVYPNPAPGGRLTLRLLARSAAVPATVQLLNPLGQVMLSQSLPSSGGEHVLAAAGLPAGLYILRVLRPEGLSSQRVTLE